MPCRAGQTANLPADKYRLLITNGHMKTLLIILKAEYFLY